ncbi:MAG: N-6 DNA methylase, partial [Planctomycetaceae bacterium]|nr:N-6 DNA methylase [Planctomycetaceae bacterium]
MFQYAILPKPIEPSAEKIRAAHNQYGNSGNDDKIREQIKIALNNEIPASLNTKEKRKRDGIFNTEQQITSYIVENTLGKLCNDKKAEIGITDESKSLILEKFQEYRNWLLTLTICDPACGSGAFLNEAFDFLLREHHFIDEIEAKIQGLPVDPLDVTNEILNNNLFGVDINEESVEITKLALWLRTAKPNRKLNFLDKNIKCGNSLISDPKIDPEKAFDWHKEFPHVFKKGGFDVVIGNPPYVDSETMVNAGLTNQ